MAWPNVVEWPLGWFARHAMRVLNKDDLVAHSLASTSQWVNAHPRPMAKFGLLLPTDWRQEKTNLPALFLIA